MTSVSFRKAASDNSQSKSGESTFSDHMLKLKNAIFVCPICGELMLAPFESWGDGTSPQEVRTNTGRRRPNGQKKLEINIHFSRNFRWKFAGKLNEELSQVCETEAAACSVCAAQALSLLAEQTDFFVEQSLYLSRNAGVDKRVVEKVEAQVRKLKDEYADFVAASKMRDAAQFEWRREQLTFTPKMIELPRAAPDEDRVGVDHSGGFSSLILCRAFYIHFDGYFGAINGLRLGWIPVLPVPQWEIKCALAELGRLIEVVSVYTRVVVNRIRVREELEVLGEDGVFAPVETGFAKGTRQNTEFNRQIATVFGICAEIFQSKALTTTVFSPMFAIDVTQQTIGGESFLFNKKKPDEWSKSMRLLLMNFKLIQTRALEKAVYEIGNAKGDCNYFT